MGILPYCIFVKFGICQTQLGKQTKFFRPQIAGGRLGQTPFPMGTPVLKLL
jgi:hypothetical protein